MSNPVTRKQGAFNDKKHSSATAAITSDETEKERIASWTTINLPVFLTDW